MKIAVVGSGYVGLVTGTCFSEVGIDVTCVDIDLQKIEKLRKGEIPVYEPGLEEMVHRNMEHGRLRFTGSMEEALDDCGVLFIAVGTPPDENGHADLQHVLSVARDCGKYMKDYLLVATKSTVPVGTSHKVKQVIKEELNQRGLTVEFDVASNPEFLKEGAAIEDFLKPDRIVVGLDSPRAEEMMKSLYKPFTLNGHPIIFMDIISAEMTKYTANAMLATRISFINDIANLCELTGANIDMVRKGIGSDPRIGNKFIYPGIGYGGSCFPKDVKALISTARKYNYDLRLLKAVEAVNNEQKSVLFQKIMKYYNGDLKGKTIAVWGLSFKPQTDDIREAPSLTIIRNLIEQGAKIKAYDPVAMKEAKRILGDTITYSENRYEAVKDADCLSLVTEWAEFKFPDFDLMAGLLKTPVIFDGRNIYDAAEMKRRGFDYFCIGIATTKESD